MSAFLIANMAPIMFASLVVVLLLGYPAAFSLGAVGLIYAFVGIQLGEFRPDFLQALPERVYGVMNNDTLLAIPFFTFMGLVLERSGMAEDLLDTIGQLFGTIRGGLAYAVVFVGALLAATTGVVAASVISMGLISLPIMLRYGYDRRVATGVIAVVNWLTSRLGFRFLSHMAQQTTFVMVPPLFLIFLVLGTIFIGIATPTEGGAMGATGAIILGAAKRRLSWDLIRQATESTAKLSAFVVFILVGARVFSLTFYGV